MLPEILKLLDNLATLSREREKNNLDYVERYAQPAYELSQEVFRDYMKLLASLRHRIASGESRQSLLLFLEQARVEYLAARIRLRAMLHQHHSKGDMPLFERGIFRLLHGGLVHLEETQFVRSSSDYGEHTLLDVIYRIQNTEGDRDEHLSVERITRFIEAQERTLEYAFKEISLGFEELRKGIISKP
jgi:hypothetical protein